MKNYVGEIMDLTSDGYLNPVPAVYDNGVHPRAVGSIANISIHHDATDRPHDYDSVARYHTEAAGHYTRLGPGLQYHYKIDNVGQIFAIRPWTTWLYCVGSAENVSTLAICLDGNFENQMPTREQYEALFQLLKELCTQHPEFPATWPEVRPHRDFSATACPGGNLAPYIFSIQDEATAASYPSVPFDWPANQPDGTVPSTPAPAPTPTQPAPAPAPLPTEPGSTVETPPVVPTTPPPVIDPHAPEAAHDYGQENNDLLHQILALLQALWAKVTGIFK